MLILNNCYYMTPENVRLVLGYKMHAIYNLQQLNYIHSDKQVKEIFELLSKSKLISENKSILIFKKYSNYLNTLISNGYLIKIPRITLKNFRDLSLSYKNTNVIDNAIIYISQSTFKILNDFIKELEDLNCRNLAIVINTNCFDLRSVLEYFSISSITSIDLILLNNATEKDFNYLSENIKDRIRFVYSKTKLETNEFINIVLSSLRKVTFNPSIQTFIEASSYNLYYNKKIILNSDAKLNSTKIKYTNFGDLKNNIKYCINKNNIPKFKIDICSDCEFRMMCIDSREVSVRKNQSFYYKNECEYNPYIAKWKDEDGYKTLEECGVFCNENEFSVDHNKIANINNI